MRMLYLKYFIISIFSCFFVLVISSCNDNQYRNERYAKENMHRMVIQKCHVSKISISTFLDTQVNQHQIFLAGREKFSSRISAPLFLPFRSTWNFLRHWNFYGLNVPLVIIISMVISAFWNAGDNVGGCLLFAFILPTIALVIILFFIGLVGVITSEINYEPYSELDIIHQVVSSPQIIKADCRKNIYVRSIITKSKPIFEILDRLSSSYQTVINNLHELEEKLSTYKIKTSNLTTEEAIKLRSTTIKILEDNIEQLYEIALSLHKKTSQSEQVLYPLGRNILNVYELSIVNEAAAEALGREYQFDATVLQDYVVTIQDFDKEMNTILNESEKLLQKSDIVKITQ